MKTFFITGTDTGIGKTTTAVWLLNKFNQQGKTTVALKPIASGCQLDSEGRLVNDDALALQQAMSVTAIYEEVNPIALKPAIAPHIAATMMGIPLSVKSVAKVCQPLLLPRAEVMLVEGAGGFMTPLNYSETLADIVTYWQMPVILVVGVRLGCLNHALLTYEMIKAKKLSMAGFVANCIDDNMAYCQDNITTLKTMLEAPLIATINLKGSLYDNTNSLFS